MASKVQTVCFSKVNHIEIDNRYMNRPESMERLSLQGVFQQYSWRRNQWCKRRKANVIVRTFPRYSPNPENDAYPLYCRTKIILHHPFRNVTSLLNREGDERSWPELFAECRAAEHVRPNDTLRNWKDENRPLQEEEDDDEDVNPDVERMTEEDWQMFARDHPNAAIPRFEVSDLGTRPLDAAWDPDAARTRWNDVNEISTYLDAQRREAGVLIDNPPNPIDIATLAGEQRAIFDRYVAEYSKILNGEEGSQILLNIDGTAGCGKTYLIHAICQELRRMSTAHDKPDPIRVLAPSGVAAFNIRGRTIHSALGLPVNTAFVPLSGSRLATLQEQWRGIIIDEKSMLGLRILAQIDSRLRQLRPYHAGDIFAGLNLALVGDFAQLPPVGDRPLYSPPSTDTTDNGALSRDGSRLYREFTQSLRLRVVHRQEGDSPEQLAFRSFLQHASNGGLTVDEWKELQTRGENILAPGDKASFNDATCLFTTREDVHTLNMQEIQALNEPCARINAKHDGGSQASQVSADDAGGLESSLVLSRRSKVMINRNIWQDHG
jgi:hypothetical protein